MSHIHVVINANQYPGTKLKNNYEHNAFLPEKGTRLVKLMQKVLINITIHKLIFELSLPAEESIREFFDACLI